MEAVSHAAQLAGADDFVRELPDGYETVIGEHGYSLSGGQRQRIAIARAVLADPRILILDDATSSVDPTKEHEIRAALAEVMHGRTTIIIAHRPATIALADRVVLLDDGRDRRRRHPRGAARTSSPEYREVLARGRAATMPASSTTKSAVADVREGRVTGGERNGLVGRRRSRGDALARRSSAGRAAPRCACCGPSATRSSSPTLVLIGQAGGAARRSGARRVRHRQRACRTARSTATPPC